MAWLIFSILVFPVGLTRLVRLAINHLVTKNLLLPALNLKLAQLNAQREKMMGEPDFQECCEYFSVETEDCLKLDTLLIHHPNQKIRQSANRNF
ncbi:MAG: hypothetical protein HWD61_02325 [Parachlamydiaceae bacterium]|nr:MAG: hypothetical protein HWD61_02325 [Parachlamydiaceae bacterium]